MGLYINSIGISTFMLIHDPASLFCSCAGAPNDPSGLLESGTLFNLEGSLDTE